MVPRSHTVHKVRSRFTRSSTRFKYVCAVLSSHPVRTTSIPSIERWCEVNYRYDRFPTVSLFGFAFLLFQTLHIGSRLEYIQYYCREPWITLQSLTCQTLVLFNLYWKKNENTTILQRISKEDRGMMIQDTLDVLDVFKYLMYWCAQPEVENKNENWAQRIGYLYKSGQDLVIVTFCTY